jgi:hypothetical protein
LSTPEAACANDNLGVAASLRLHWPEYLMEAGEMSLYLFCTSSFATVVQHPASPVRNFFVNGIIRRALMGLAIGATPISLAPLPAISQTSRSAGLSDDLGNGFIFLQSMSSIMWSPTLCSFLQQPT